jgi:shikimate dehydrogenase
MLSPQKIDGNTKLVGLLGWPVAHSLSPRIHNNAFAVLGLSYAYIPLPVTPQNLPKAIAAMRVCGFAGANVTIPHKMEAAKLCDRLTGDSVITGAVNTLYFENEKLCGTTTDADGFFLALKHIGHNPQGGRIVILGNGGVARSIGFALAYRKIPSSLAFIGRDSQKVRTLTEAIQQKTGFPLSCAAFNTKDAAQLISNASLVVNCTSVGMHPDTGKSPLSSNLLHSGITVFDTIYNPAETILISDAMKAGCKYSNGLGMLLFQGLASFRYWTGIDAPPEIFDMNELQKLVG